MITQPARRGRRLALALGGALALLATPLLAQDDGFPRERNGRTDAAKNAIEGKPAPALAVSDWMNAGEGLDLASLRGKVVVLDFWGTW